MKINMKKLAAWMLALLLVFQMIPAMADVSNILEGSGPDVLRSKLQIKSPATILEVDETYTMEGDSDYDLKWESSNPAVATVDEATGIVTATGTGTVKITATENNKNGTSFSDSIVLRVIAAEEKAEKVIIMISGNHDTITYDGDEHTAGYEISSEGDYDASKLKLVNANKIAKGTDCGLYTIKFSDGDFIYDVDGDGKNDAEIEYSNGWMKIVRKDVTLDIDDVTIKDGETPTFTAQATGLIGDDKLDYELTTISQDGKTYIVPDEDISEQGNYRVAVNKGILTIEPKGTKYDLYNLIDINNTFYRLAKTVIYTDKELSKNFDKVLNPSDYTMDEYDFPNTVLTINGKEYIYDSPENAEAIAAGARYYTATFKQVKGIKNKIGGMNGKNPRWAVPEEQRYPDKNETDSYHADYTVTLYENPIEQPLYNFLKVGNSNDYYRLKKTTIVARTVEDFDVGAKINTNQYTADDYDFTNVVLDIDGETYVYSDHDLTGDYASYFTVKYDYVSKKDRINGNVNWFNDERGWLDGENYAAEGNDVVSWHRDYIATLHKGNIQTLTVEVSSNIGEQDKVISGTEIILTGKRGGSYKGPVEITWEREDPDTGARTVIEGANEMTYRFVINEENAKYHYYIILTPIE